jgi:DNA-binding NtrC family response regulator/predicted ATPase
MADSHSHPVDHPTHRLLGNSPAMEALRAQIRHLAPFDSLGSPVVPTLLLRGETGTGKGLVARVIHDGGPRAGGPFIEVNCAAIPESMLEAELFGFEAGAFTDAKRAKPGLFEAAEEGTLLLDEVDALPLTLQGKLLTAIETKRVRRLGAVAERAVDVKLIAATNAVLEQRVAAGHFRADLYHRLAVVVLALPSLRERGDDVLLLARSLLQQYTAAHGVPPKRLSARAEAWLTGYAWPGNVREVNHVMERITLLHMGEEVDADTLIQLCLPLTASIANAEVASQPQEQEPMSFLPAEAEQIRQALAQTGGNVVRAARLLGVSRDTVRYRMQRYGISRSHFRTSFPPASPLARGADDRASPPRPHPLPPQPTEPFTNGSRFPLKRKNPGGAPAPRNGEPNAASDKHFRDTIPAWEQKPIAVLALEVTWPEVSGLEPLHYDPWTVAAHWEQALVDKVLGFGGTLVQHTASLLIWVFGLPQALEQLPQRAVHSALAIRQTVVAPTAADMPPCPEVRLAVHLGAVRVDSQVADPVARMLAVGETLALPVRLLGQAAAGEILVSPEVGRLVDGWVALEARPLQLRSGDPTRVGGYTVLGVRPARPTSAAYHISARSPFVGRERELVLLDAILEQVKAGRGQVVGLVGALGVGKSRLLAEFRQHLTGQCVRYAEGQCMAYGSVMPYLPILDLLRDHCGIAADDSPETLTAKVHTSLQEAGLDPEASRPYLVHLLGLPVDGDEVANLSAEARKARTFEAVRRLFLSSSQHQPLVLAVDNFHWIDPTSEALLASLVEGLAGASILMLATFHPGYLPFWLDKSYATQIALQPLGANESRQVVRSVLRHTSLTQALEQQLLAKAEGNPFFLEELAYTLREQAGQASVLTISDSIQAVIAARIDRLPAEQRRLLQVAAVIGKNVSVSLLQTITTLSEETLSRDMAHLQTTEFLSAAGGIPAPTYTFRHILIQEMAYQSLPTSLRRHYHERIAQALANQFSSLIETQPALLAYHYTEAGCTEQAISAWQWAGQQSAERSAYVEAIAHFTRGLSLLQELPDTPARAQQELLLQTSLGPALMATKGFAAPEVERAYARARELCQQMGETPQLFGVLRGLWRFYGVRAAFRTAQALGEQLLCLARRAEDPALLMEAHLALGNGLFWCGEIASARAHLEQVSALYDPQEHRSHAFRYGLDPGVVGLSYTAQALWLLGYPDQALQHNAEALTLAHELLHPHTLAHALGFAALFHQFRRETQAVHEQVDALMALSREQEFAQWLAWGEMLRGCVLVKQGHGAEGMRHMRQGLDAFDDIGAALGRPYWLALLAEACGTVGQAEEGQRMLAAALDAIHTTGERRWEAEIFRLQGELLLVLPQKSEAAAEACFQQALLVSRRQQAKALELRAASSLSRLWGRWGKRVEARELLGAVYGWFTEGFHTPDLQAASALIAELP